MRRECKIKVHKDNDTAVIEILGDMTESAYAEIVESVDEIATDEADEGKQ